jgi:hypothetical protein
MIKALLMASIVLLITVSQYTMATVSNSLSVKLNPSSEHLDINRTLIVNVTLLNTNDFAIKDVAIYLTAPGFTIQQEPKWPVVLYPFSQVEGFYTLKPISEGKSDIWISAFYLPNVTTIKSGSIQKSITSKPFTVFVNRNPLDFKLPEPWTTVITTIIGAIVGAAIPGINKRINRKREIEKQHRESIIKVKNLLRSELEVNNRLIESSQESSLALWNKVVSESYFLLRENPTLESAFLDLYIKLNSYNKLQPTQRDGENKDIYYQLINKARNELERWSTKTQA